MDSNCSNCGKASMYRYIEPIDDELARTWRLSVNQRKRFNFREGSLCVHCGASIRAQGLAKAILLSKYGFGAKSLVEWVKKANQQKLKVCELNSCQELHKTLLGLRSLTYAEYGTISQQDIENLTYRSNSFDIVLHSDTLEHVSNPKKAMDECRRVLKKEGLVLFTTPVLWTRRTKRRAEKRENKIYKFLEPSYHAQQTDDYLVYFEYGYDIDKILGCDVVYAEPTNQAFVFSSTKQKQRIKRLLKIKFATLRA